MFLAKNKNIYILNVLISLFPFSFIAGNLVLNLNVLIIIIYSFFLFRFKIFKFNFNLVDKLLIFLFFYIFLNGALNNYFNFNFSEAPDNLIIKKSFLFIRFIFFYLVLRFLLENKLLNFKLIFISFSISGLFVSLDVILQFFSGKDIFGFEATERRLTGPFNDEAIAGSFIQRFFIFILFSILIFYKIKNQIHLNIFLIFILTIGIFSLIFAGNRVPLILFLLSLLIMFFYIKNLRKILISAFLILTIGLFTIINFSSESHSHYTGFAIKSSQIVNYLKKRISGEKITIDNVYIKEINYGVLTWQENKYFGGGIKSFRWHCSKIDKSKVPSYFKKDKGIVQIANCNNHPHNYYLEIASELGLVGVFIILTLLALILVRCVKTLHFSNEKDEKKYFLLPFFLMFILEFFPFKTTGSFFSTTNANFIFLILPFVVGLTSQKK